jgi:hypothetical protein
MVHSMPATRNSKLKLKYDKNGVSSSKFNNVYQILKKIIKIVDYKDHKQFTQDMDIYKNHTQ